MSDQKNDIEDLNLLTAMYLNGFNLRQLSKYPDVETPKLVCSNSMARLLLNSRYQLNQ